MLGWCANSCSVVVFVECVWAVAVLVCPATSLPGPKTTFLVEVFVQPWGSRAVGAKTYVSMFSHGMFRASTAQVRGSEIEIQRGNFLFRLM